MTAIKLMKCSLDRQRAINEYGEVWTVQGLIRKAEDLPVFDLPLKHIDISILIWGHCKSMADFAGHMKQALESDLSKPIIMSDEGWIMDGWHRIVKALVEGRETIKAVRFDVTPEYDYKEK